MTKEIIEAEIERLFPHFNHAEMVAATMGAEWMQKELDKDLSDALFIQRQMLIEKACEYIMTHPAYAVQPEVYAEGLKQAMLK